MMLSNLNITDHSVSAISHMAGTHQNQTTTSMNDLRAALKTPQSPRETVGKGAASRSSKQSTAPTNQFLSSEKALADLRDNKIAKLTQENELLRSQVARQGEILLNAAKKDGKLMPAQMSTLLSMQRERIDYLEANYSKLYQRYETQIRLTGELRKQISQVGTSPSSGVNQDIVDPDAS